MDENQMDENQTVQIDPDGCVLVCTQCSRVFPSDGKFCPFDGSPLSRKVASVRDALLGRVIDSRYQVLSVLGQGGTGTVFAVRHSLLGKHFALKVLRREFTSDDEAAGRFVREAQAIARVKHPNVCEISDFGQLPDGRPYFVMELLSGHSLSWWLSHGGAPPVAAAVTIADKVAAALGAAHQAGVVHRDLKPANILVDDALEPRQVKVVDFGLAHVAGQVRSTRPGLISGTPYYISPEQARGEAVDLRSDLYSLGVVLYELLTGCVPFEADSHVGVLTQHMHVAPLPPSQVAGAPELGVLEEIVLRCLSKSPERRYQSAGALALDLRAALGSDEQGRPSVLPRRMNAYRPPALSDALEPPLRHATPRPGDTRAFRPRRRVWGWLAAAAALGGGALIAYRQSLPPRASASPDVRASAAQVTAGVGPASDRVQSDGVAPPAPNPGPIGDTADDVVSSARVPAKPVITPRVKTGPSRVQTAAVSPTRERPSRSVATPVSVRERAGTPEPPAAAPPVKALPTVPGGIVDPWSGPAR